MSHNQSARVAKVLALLAIRNSPIENIHTGKMPVSHTGDFSDVYVVDADGNKIPWNQTSHISQDEMKKINKSAVNTIYAFLTKLGDPSYNKTIEYAYQATEQWDDPE